MKMSSHIQFLKTNILSQKISYIFLHQQVSFISFFSLSQFLSHIYTVYIIIWLYKICFVKKLVASVGFMRFNFPQLRFVVYHSKIKVKS